MSNRQERKARKERQRAGVEVFVHDGPSRGTRPYMTRQQRKQDAVAGDRMSYVATSVAAGLALSVAPKAMSFLMRGGKRFGEEQS